MLDSETVVNFPSVVVLDPRGGLDAASRNRSSMFGGVSTLIGLFLSSICCELSFTVCGRSECVRCRCCCCSFFVTNCSLVCN